jgi:hypothetical protein
MTTRDRPFCFGHNIQSVLTIGRISVQRQFVSSHECVCSSDDWKDIGTTTIRQLPRICVFFGRSEGYRYNDNLSAPTNVCVLRTIGRISVQRQFVSSHKCVCSCARHPMTAKKNRMRIRRRGCDWVFPKS